MNKQELIKKYEEIYKVHSPFNETVCYAMMVYSFVEELKKLDEPEKTTVARFVADWIKHCRGIGYSLHQSMTLVNENVEIKKWLLFVDNQDLFARAWLDSYEVEEEKRYYIRLKNVDENYNYLTCIKHLNAWALTEIKRDKKFRTEHTRKEIEKGGFGEVFDSPLFEVEEVEE